MSSINSSENKENFIQKYYFVIKAIFSQLKNQWVLFRFVFVLFLFDVDHVH